MMTEELICPICGKDVWAFLHGKFGCPHGARDMIAAVNDARAWARKIYRIFLVLDSQRASDQATISQLRTKLEESDADNFIQSACLNKQSDLITELRQENAALRRKLDDVIRGNLMSISVYGDEPFRTIAAEALAQMPAIETQKGDKE